MNLTEKMRSDGRMLGVAIAQEAVVECTTPEYGKQATTVKFHDPEREEMSLNTYMKAIEFLGNRAVDYFDVPHSFEVFEEGLYSGLRESGALRDLTKVIDHPALDDHTIRQML